MITLLQAADSRCSTQDGQQEQLGKQDDDSALEGLCDRMDSAHGESIGENDYEDYDEEDKAALETGHDDGNGVHDDDGDDQDDNEHFDDLVWCFIYRVDHALKINFAPILKTYIY